MDPATIGMAFSALSGVFSVVQGISGMNTEKQNALNNKADAKLAETQGQNEATRQRNITRAQQSELLANTGASGTLATGSPMEAYLANAKQGEMEAQDKIYAGNLKSRSLKAAAKINSRQATSQLIGGLGAGAATLGGMFGRAASTTATPTTTAPVEKKWY